MRNYTHSAQITPIAWVLVFIVIFSTVAPASGLAADTVNITNNANATSDTGGRSSDGADGKDGKDGKDGEDGKPGADGEDVTTGNSSASAQIKTQIDGETVVDIEKHATATGGTSSASVHTTSTTGTTSTSSVGSASVGSTSEALKATPDPIAVNGEASEEAGTVSLFKRTITSIKDLLNHYVKILF